MIIFLLINDLLNCVLALLSHHFWGAYVVFLQQSNRILSRWLTFDFRPCLQDRFNAKVYELLPDSVDLLLLFRRSATCVGFRGIHILLNDLRLFSISKIMRILANWRFSFKWTCWEIRGSCCIFGNVLKGEWLKVDNTPKRHYFRNGKKWSLLNQWAKITNIRTRSK